MKNQRIIDAMSFISDEIILKADEMPERKSRNPRMMYFLPIGAACAAAFACAFAFRAGLFGRKPDVPATPVSSITAESASEPEKSETPAVSASIGAVAGSVPEASEKVTVEINYDKLPFSYHEGELSAITELKPFYAGGGGMGLPDAEGAVWNEDMLIERLPVFSGAERGMFKPEAYISILERYAANIGETLTDVSYTPANPAIFGQDAEGLTDRLTARAGEVTFEVDLLSAAGEYNITASGFSGDISELLGYEKPTAAGNVIFEGSDDLFTAILDHDLRKVRKLGDKYMICEQLSALECAGMYPAVSADEAKALLGSGKYKAQWTGADYDKNAAADLITLEYKMTSRCDLFVPFYVVCQNGETFLLPAISPEYADAEAHTN